MAALRAAAGAAPPARGPRRPPAGRLDSQCLPPGAGARDRDPPAPLPAALDADACACLWAAEQGRLRELKHALYEAFFCEGEDIATDREIARAAERAGLDPDGAIAAAYSPERGAQLRRSAREAEAAGVRGVPSLLAEDGEHHWGMGGLERLLAGEPLVPRDQA